MGLSPQCSPQEHLGMAAKVSAMGKERLACPGVSVLRMTTACGGMNSVQGQGATATPS